MGKQAGMRSLLEINIRLTWVVQTTWQQKFERCMTLQVSLCLYTKTMAKHEREQQLHTDTGLVYRLHLTLHS